MILYQVENINVRTIKVSDLISGSVSDVNHNELKIIQIEL